MESSRHGSCHSSTAAELLIGLLVGGSGCIAAAGAMPRADGDLPRCTPPASAAAVAAPPDTSAPAAALPEGSETLWVVREPEELVTYVLFDPATVEDRLPPGLRFITVGEVAGHGLPWATEHLVEEPAHARWGISFLEIVRAGVFELGGRSPHWPEHGAAALWAARVAPSDPSMDRGGGVPFLLLEFWIPDSAFVAYMRDRGAFATYGDARLRQDGSGEWSGAIDARGLRVAGSCRPSGPISGGEGSHGMQVFFPPRSCGTSALIRVAFAGHRIQECSADSRWKLDGSHPLAHGIVLGSTTYQFGYTLAGGVYRR